MSVNISTILKTHEIRLKRLDELLELGLLTPEYIKEYEDELIRKNGPHPKPIEKPKVDPVRSGRFSRAYPPPKTQIPNSQQPIQEQKIEQPTNNIVKTPDTQNTSKLPPHLRKKMQLLNKNNPQESSEPIIKKPTNKLSLLEQNISDIEYSIEEKINNLKTHIQEAAMSKQTEEIINKLKQDNSNLQLEIKKYSNDMF
jgi:predicted amino acid-binding ACT domain protein